MDGWMYEEEWSLQSGKFRTHDRTLARKHENARWLSSPPRDVSKPREVEGTPPMSGHLDTVPSGTLDDLSRPVIARSPRRSNLANLRPPHFARTIAPSHARTNAASAGHLDTSLRDTR
jgi:hypothetical protein